MNEERYRKLKASAQRYTAYRERAPKEVIDKLKEWSAPEPIIDRILSELREDDFVNEHRFARAFCHDKFMINKWGKNRLKAEMGRYGLSNEAKHEGLDYLKPEEYARTLDHLAQKKWDRLKEEDLYKKKQKTALYLANKGFEAGLVWEVVNGLEG